MRLAQHVSSVHAATNDPPWATLSPMTTDNPYRAPVYIKAPSHPHMIRSAVPSRNGRDHREQGLDGTARPEGDEPKCVGHSPHYLRRIPVKNSIDVCVLVSIGSFWCRFTDNTRTAAPLARPM